MTHEVLPAYLDDDIAATKVALASEWPREDINLPRVARIVAEVERLRADVLRLGALAQDVRLIATHGATPDGDEVNVPTLLWAEDWTRKLDAAIDAAMKATS